MKIYFLVFCAVAAGEPRFLPKFKYTGSIWPHPQQITTSEVCTYAYKPTQIEFQTVFGVSNYVDVDYEEGSERCEILTDVFDRYGGLIRGSVGNRFTR